MTDYAIGPWRFRADAGELIRAEDRRKLEHRAARTLELLCASRGAVVTREAILDSVWQGRAVSANSVAIVIGDLREALEDDARSPRFIETVAKRGYRLREGAAEPAGKAKRPRWWIPVAAAVLALAGLGIWTSLPATARLAVPPVVNATGDAKYAPLTDASDAVLLDAARRETALAVVRGPATLANDDLRLTSRLILWSGKPTLMMQASDARGKVVFTAMSRGGEDVIPGDVRTAMRGLKARLEAR